MHKKRYFLILILFLALIYPASAQLINPQMNVSHEGWTEYTTANSYIFNINDWNFHTDSPNDVFILQSNTKNNVNDNYYCYIGQNVNLSGATGIKINIGDIATGLGSNPKSINHNGSFRIMVDGDNLYSCRYTGYNASNNEVKKLVVNFPEQYFGFHTIFFRVDSGLSGYAAYMIDDAYLTYPSGSGSGSDSNINDFSQSSISFDKNAYDKSDTAIISYTNADSDSTINLHTFYNNVSIDNITYPVNHSGALNIDLSEFVSFDSMQADLLDNNLNVIASSDPATCLCGNYYLQGRVLNSATGAAINNANINIAGTDIQTDSEGNYGVNIPAGINFYDITKSGYNELTGYVSVIDLVSTHNFYMSPTLATMQGSGIYGTVTSSKTDYPLTGALVTLSDGENSYSAITDSKGYYIIKPENLQNGTYSVTVSKQNYDTQSFNIQIAGMTYEQFSLVASTGYNEPGTASYTSGSGSGSGVYDNVTGVSSERPGREAARQSMKNFETNIPGLFSLVIFKVIMELLK